MVQRRTETRDCGTECQGDGQCYRDCARQLHVAAMEFRLFAMLSRIKINMWLAIPDAGVAALSPPSLADLNHLGSLRFFTLYSNLTRAVSELGRHYGTSFATNC